jgi:sugar phosphate isomerase/epimerase
MGPGGELGILDAMGDRTIAYHLSDSSGDRDIHIAPGRGNVGWKAFFRHPVVARFDGIFCIETPPFAHGPGYTDDAWRELVYEVRGLTE